MLLPGLSLGLFLFNDPAPVEGGISVALESETLGSAQVTIAGNGGSGEKLSFIALQLICQGSARGTLTAVGTNSLTDAAASTKWADDQFNGANGSFFVEITSGVAVGATSDITDTTGTGVLTTVDDLSALASPPVATDSYFVRPHVTLAKLLPGGGGLNTDGDVNVADNVLVSLANGTVETFYHDGSNWILSGPESNADDETVMPEQGLVIRRRQASSADLNFFGVAKEGISVVPIETGYNLVGALRAAAAISLDNLGLEGKLTSGLNASDADNLLIIEANGAVSRYFYLTGGGGNPADGWYDLGYNPAGSVTIAPGSAFYILRKSGGPFNWTLSAQ